MPMITDISPLLQHIFQVNNLEDVDLLQLEQLTARYPYFAPLQYLLAKKYKLQDIDVFGKQITKTAIFFSNPHWLNDLILSDQERPESRDAGNSAAQEIVPATTDIAPVADDLRPEAGPEPVLPVGDETVAASADLPLNETNTAAVEMVLEEQEFEMPGSQETEPVVLPEPEMPVEADTFSSEAVEQFQESDEPSDVSAESRDPEPEEKQQTAGGLTEQHVAENQQSVTGNTTPLVPIEPYYTVDYFASQGIKLNVEEEKDKLSQKLRSFTEWLKTMKRLHPEKLEQEMSSHSSTVIQHIAEHSNEMEDVVTEAMAEVYARQGLRNKAAEVYQKLSLLNPDKRTYFAARISKLNEI